MRSSLQKRNPAPASAGVFQDNSSKQRTHTGLDDSWQQIGGIAGAIVASVAARRAEWIRRRCRVSGSHAAAVAALAFSDPGVRHDD